MEISGEKTKIMTNNINGMTTALHIAGNTLDEVQSFKYLGAIISEEGSKPEVLARIAQATAALSILKKIWRDRNITLRSKIRLCTFACDIYLPICMRKLGHLTPPTLQTSNTSNGDEMLCQTRLPPPWGRSYPRERRHDLNSSWFSRPDFSLSKCLWEKTKKSRSKKP